MRASPIIALWFASLIVLMPVFSAQALASITITKFSGADNLPGIARSEDTVNIEAEVSSTDIQQMYNSDFKTVVAGVYSSAVSCLLQANGSNTYICTNSYPLFGGGGRLNFEFQLLQQGVLLEHVSKTLNVDNTGAEVTSITTDPRIQNSHASVSYVVRDTLTGSSTSACAGIDRVDLYFGGVAGSPIKTKKGNGGCTESGTFTDVSISKSGTQTLCALAYDRLDQTDGPSCTVVDVDSGPPGITEANVTDSNGNPVHFLSKNGGMVDIAVIMNAPDLVSSSVYADMSGITGDSSDDHIAPSRILGVEPKIAIWEGVVVQRASACQLKVHAEDNVGGVSEKTVSCGLEEDNSPPQLVSLTSPFVEIVNASVAGRANATTEQVQQPIIGRKGQIIATFNEQGAGLNNRYVFLDASKLGLSSSLRAKNCSTDGSSWQCVWDVAPQKGGLVLLKLADSSRDDVGNRVEASTNIPVTFRSTLTGPQNLQVVEFKPLHGSVDVGNLTINGDILEMKVKADNFVSAFADFSQIGGNISNCDSREGTICTFSSPVTISGPADVSALFTFVDAGGNNATLSYPFKVYGTKNDTAANYWRNTLVCTPSSIDRSLTTLINNRIYCHIKLTSQTPGIETNTIDFTPSECSGDVANIGDLGLSNNYAGSTDPVLYVLLAATTFKVNNLRFMCPLRITSRIGDFVNIIPESENVSIQINFYSLPQEDLSKSVMNKFNQAKKDALKLDGLIGTLKKFFEIAEKICQIRGLIMNALTAIDNVMALIEYIESGALNMGPPIGSLIAPCEMPKSAGVIAPGLSGAIKTAYGISETNAQKRGQNVASNQKGPTDLGTTGAQANAGVATPKPQSPGDACKAQEAINADNKAKEELRKAMGEEATSATDNGVDAAVDAAKDVAIPAYQTLCNSKCAASGPPAPACTAVCVAEVAACKGAIEEFGKIRSAHNKIEAARSKICNNKEGLVEAFKCSIDKFAGPFCQMVNCQSGPLNQADGIFGKVMSALGGGAGLNPNNFLPTIGGQGGISPSVPVKESLVWSVASLCLPGIINNVDKYRQINCEYALCIGKDVVERGLPISACEKKKESLMCQFIWGQVFNSVPYLGAVQSWINTLKEMITNPIAAITFVLGKYCKSFCDESRSDQTAMMYRVCAFPKVLDAVAAVVKDIQTIIKPDFWKLSESQCDQLKDYKPPKVSKNVTTTAAVTGVS